MFSFEEAKVDKSKIKISNEYYINLENYEIIKIIKTTIFSIIHLIKEKKTGEKFILKTNLQTNNETNNFESESEVPPPTKGHFSLPKFPVTL